MNRMALIAVYDACVLYPAFLRDFLVWLAVAGRRRRARSDDAPGLPPNPPPG